MGGGEERTRSNSPVSNRDFLVPTGFIPVFFVAARSNENRDDREKERKKKKEKKEKPLNASRTGFASKRNGKLNEGVSPFILFILGTTSLEEFERFD